MATNALMAATRYIYLVSPEGRCMFAEADWKALLQLAHDYGWTPMGTVPPPDRDDLSWDRTYYPGQDQSLSAEDAGHFAASLERAMADIPRRDDQPVNAPPVVSPIGIGALEYYRGTRRALLQRLIDGGRAGAIQIEKRSSPSDPKREP